MKYLSVFFSKETPPSTINTLSLHDALPISDQLKELCTELSGTSVDCLVSCNDQSFRENIDRKSTRLNSSHVSISYAVFCLKKKKSLAMASGSAKSAWERRGWTRALSMGESR